MIGLMGAQCLIKLEGRCSGHNSGGDGWAGHPRCYYLRNFCNQMRGHFP